MIGMAPTTLIAHPSFPAHSITELVAHAKQNPGKLNFGSPGVGTVGHIAGELFDEHGRHQAFARNPTAYQRGHD